MEKAGERGGEKKKGDAPQGLARKDGREREKFIIRQPPIGEKDDYDSENSWISDGLPSSSSRKRRRGEGRGEGGVWREKWSASEVDVELTVPKARSRSREGATLDEAPRISLRESL